jgi:arsenate reductase
VSIKVYAYKNCGTCQKAAKWLGARGVAFKEVPIRETPPTVAELKKMLKAMGGDVRKLFNTSGMDYKALNMKDKLPGMSEAEALELLASNGNLVKRPFVLGDGVATVGFKAEAWAEMFGNRE